MALSEGAPVRVAVIGLGRFGRLHALTLAGLAEAELVGLVARRTESVESLQQELPGVPGWTDLGVADSDRASRTHRNTRGRRIRQVGRVSSRGQGNQDADLGTC